MVAEAGQATPRAKANRSAFFAPQPCLQRVADAGEGEHLGCGVGLTGPPFGTGLAMEGLPNF